MLEGGPTTRACPEFIEELEQGPPTEEGVPPCARWQASDREKTAD
jgi:hypothetical protein